MTLYHWDLPQALQDEGGWANRDIADWFEEFADIAGEAFGDRVPKWITLNEPWVVAHVGYRDGRHAPGVRDAAQAVAANHHLLLAHGRAVGRAAAVRFRPAGRDHAQPDVERPVTPEAADHAAVLEARQNGVYLDPLFRGRYPELLDGDADYSPAAAGPGAGRRLRGHRRRRSTSSASTSTRRTTWACSARTASRAAARR